MEDKKKMDALAENMASFKFDLNLYKIGTFTFIISIIVITSCCLLCINALASDKDVLKINEPAKWTVMMYIALDEPHMEKFLSYELMKLQAVGSTQDVNIVVEADRFGSPSSDPYADWPDARRFYIKKTEGISSDGDFKISRERAIKYINSTNLDLASKIEGASQKELDELAMGWYEEEILDSNPLQNKTAPSGLQQKSIERLGEINTGDPNSLKNFVTWAMDEYPAEHYMLVLLGHGGGWTFYGLDKTPGLSRNKTADFLDMKELNQALASISNETGVGKLDLLVWHACLMDQLEVMANIAPYVDYSVASQENLLSAGWDYISALNSLTENPNMTGKEVGMTLVKSTLSYYRDGKFGKKDSMGTFYLLDMSKVDGVLKAIDNFSNVVTIDTKQELNDIATARNNVQIFSYGDPSFASVDLIHFMQLISITSSSDEIKKAANDVIDATSRMIIYGSSNECATNANGLSIYYPSNALNYASIGANYSTLNPDMSGWQKYLGKLYPKIDQVCGSGNLSIDMRLLFNDTTYSLHNDPIVIFNYDGTGIEYLLFSVYTSAPPDKMVRIFTYPITDKKLYELKGKYIEISKVPDGPQKGQWLNWVRVPPTTSYALSDGNVKTPVDLVISWANPYQGLIKGLYYPNEGDPFPAFLVVDMKAWEVSSVWTSGIKGEDGAETRSEITIKPGDRFKPTFERFKSHIVEDKKTGKEDIVISQDRTEESITGKTYLTFGYRPLVVDYMPLPKGTYWLSLEIADIAGNKKRDISPAIRINNTRIADKFMMYTSAPLGTRFLIPTDFDVREYSMRPDDRRLAFISAGRQVGGAMAFRATGSLDLDLKKVLERVDLEYINNLSFSNYTFNSNISETATFNLISKPRLNSEIDNFRVFLVHEPISQYSYVFSLLDSLSFEFEAIQESVEFFEPIDRRLGISIESQLNPEDIAETLDPLRSKVENRQNEKSYLNQED